MWKDDRQKKKKKNKPESPKISIFQALQIIQKKKFSENALNQQTYPLALVSQWGANKPENAGTKYTSPLSFTEDAKSAVSFASFIIPNESRNHFTAAPVMAIEP